MVDSILRPAWLALLGSVACCGLLLVGCAEDGDEAPSRQPGVTISGLLGHGQGSDSDTAALTAALHQALGEPGLAIVVLGTDASTETFPVEEDGSFAVQVQPNASYTLNVLDTSTDTYVGSFLYRSGDNLSLALRVGAEDIDLGSCQLLNGEVWCANGFFDAPVASGEVRPLDGHFGGVRMSLLGDPADAGVVQELIGGTEAEFEIAPNPLNKYHVAMFNKTRFQCTEPLLGVAEQVGDELYMYLQRVQTNETCSATVRYQATCTLKGATACEGFLRVDIASSGEDCAAFPAIHVAQPFRSVWHSPDVISCRLPATCSQPSDCPSGVCDSAVNFCAEAPRDQALRVYLFDVGNGQSLLAITPDGTSVLMDAGRPQAGRLVSAVLRRLITRLDYMVLSHFDDDHAGGAVPIMLGPDGAPGRRGVDDDGLNGIDDEAEVGTPNSDDLLPQVVLDRGLTPMPNGFEQYVRLLGDRRREAIAGEELALGGGVTMTVLSANGRIKGGAAFAVKDENERSVGVILRQGEFSFLNLGDLPGGGIGTLKMEQAVAPILAADAPIDVQLLSHHGSSASSPIDVLRALKPRVALLSVGDSDRCGAGFNSYGLPAQVVLDNLNAAGGVRRVYQTQTGGASFSGSCVVESGQAYPRNYGELDPAFAYSVLTVEAYPETFRVSGLTFDDHYTAVGCSGDQCLTCPVGYLDNPERPGTCIVDPCVPDPCNAHGSCSFAAIGEYACACAAHFTGDSCEQCETGYAGAECAACAEGYMADPAAPGDCVVDPCLPDPCSGNGDCSRPGGGLFACECSGHYAGERCAECAAGYAGVGCAGCAKGYLPDPGATTLCIDDPCAPEACHGNGSCTVLAGGVAACACLGNFVGPDCGACATGYDGLHCNECAPGFVADPERPAICLPDPCLLNPCSGHGACEVLAGGDHSCDCDDHFVGLACSRCATGYTGPSCSACAVDFVRDPGDGSGCVLDECTPDPCSGHGNCAVLAGGGHLCACAGHFVGTRCDRCAAGYVGAGCNSCAAGYVPDPGAPGSCVIDPCQPDPCSGHGACVVLAGGSARCDCAGHFVGAACDACAEGYAGAGCDSCAAGHVADPGTPGACVEDPCDPDPCSGHGQCAVLAGGAHRCSCAGHFVGLACDACAEGYDGAGCADCAAGYLPDPGAPTTCVDDPCTPAPCGHGSCTVLAGGTKECGCDERWAGPACGSCADGYAGAGCADCAPGYVHDPVRPLTCIDDPCNPDPCSGHGTCGVQPGGAAACACTGRWSGTSCERCLRGYAGATCDSCAAGYLPDPDAAGECIVDPCASDPCHGHGLCSVLADGSGACACSGHFTGPGCDQCAEGWAGVACADCAPGWHAAAGGCLVDVEIDGCQLLTGSYWTGLDETTLVSGSVLAAGSDAAGPLEGLLVSACFSEAPIDFPVVPAELICEDAIYLGDEAGADVFAAEIAFAAAADWNFVYVVSGDGGFSWTGCDLDGTADGPLNAGVASAFNVPNGGVERWTAEPLLPEGWASDIGLGVERAADLHHSGSASVKLTRNTTVAGDTDFSAPLVPVWGGVAYVASIWFWDNDPTVKSNVVVAWYDADRLLLSTSYGTTYTRQQESWQSITRTVTAPANAAFLRLGVRLHAEAAGAPTGGAIYLDDAAVVAP